MKFNDITVPGACWIEIIEIRNKDQSPLSEDNWRHKLIGRVTLCWIAGGFKERALYFQGHLRLCEEDVIVIDLDSKRWTSSTTAQPIEIETNIYDFETNTSIYRLRLLSKEEENKVLAAVLKYVQAVMKARNLQCAAADDIPAS